MKKIVLIIGLLISSVFGEKVTVFAASSTKLAMEEIVTEFKKQNPSDEVDIYFSATGKAFAQFTNGFKYDIFMAADAKYPATIENNGRSTLEEGNVFNLRWQNIVCITWHTVNQHKCITLVPQRPVITCSQSLHIVEAIGIVVLLQQILQLRVGVLKLGEVFIKSLQIVSLSVIEAHL